MSFLSEMCVEEDLIIKLTMPGLYRKFFYVLLGSTPNLQELCQRREQLAPSPLAMEAQQIVAHDLLQSPHLLEISRRKLNQRVLLFSDNGLTENDAVTLIYCSCSYCCCTSKLLFADSLIVRRSVEYLK